MLAVRTFVAIAAAALSLSLCAPPAACGEEAEGSETAEEASEEEFQEAEESVDLISRTTSTSHPKSEKIALISIGAAGGLATGYAGGFGICFGLAGSANPWALYGCLVSPISITMGVLGGGAGAYELHRTWKARRADEFRLKQERQRAERERQAAIERAQERIRAAEQAAAEEDE